MAVTIDFYDPITMRAAITRIPPHYTFIRDTFFKGRQQFPTEKVVLDFRRGVRQMSPFVKRLEKAKVMGRQSYVTRMYTTPLTAPARVLEARDLIRRLQGEPLFTNMTEAERAMGIIAQDLEYLITTIDRREEWMCAQVLFTGTCTCVSIDVDGNEEDLVVNYGFTNSVTLTGTSTWDQSTADPLNDLDTWQTNVQMVGFVRPTMAIWSNDVYQQFSRHINVQQYFWAQRFDIGAIDPRMQNDAVTYVGRLKKPELDIFIYNEWYPSDADGTMQPLVPKGTSTLLNPEMQNGIAYGAVTELYGNEEQANWVSDMAPRVPRLLNDVQNDLQKIKVSSRPLPYIEDQMTWAVMKVLP